MYALGIDVGTTFSSAALWRSGRSEICSLGNRSTVIPSIVYAGPDGSIVVGELAGRRALSEPQRVGREFKRRFGDSVPLLLGGAPYSADALTAELLAAVLEQVTAREGAPPGAVCITHPANWGPFKIDLLRQAADRAMDRAIDQAGVHAPVMLTSEPEAAAVFYAVERPIATGDVIAVYDLGGGTFDATVLRKAPDGFELLGRPVGIEQLGGMDIDAAVLGHVARNVGRSLTEPDRFDTAQQPSLAMLNRECVEAKEALSVETEVTIPVHLAGVSTEVRLLRSELEQMIRPMLTESVAALGRAIASAGVEVGDVTSVLLIGGAARTPLVAELVGSTLNLPVVVDTHPKHPVALGAAWRASTMLSEAPAPRAIRPVQAPREPAPPAVPVAPVAAFATGGDAPTAEIPQVDDGPVRPGEVLLQDPFGTFEEQPEEGARRRRFRPLLVGSGVLLLVVLVSLGARELLSTSDPDHISGAGQTLGPGSGSGELPGAGPTASASVAAGADPTGTEHGTRPGTRTGTTAGGTTGGTTGATSRGVTTTGTGSPTAGAAPKVALAVSPASGHMDLTVQAKLTLSGGTSPLTRRIDWGDGTTQTLSGTTASHKYTTPCTCTAKLKVTDAGGHAVSATATVTVAALAYGPDTCIQGYVWREASSTDHVCVTGDVRAQTAADNAQAAARVNPDGGAYGPDTCLQGYVWREAYGSSDHVCVTGDVRSQAAFDNAHADERLERNADQ